ncbi:MAG: hypothetical protein K8823_929 [Cenarchaeum symbiont of Oopsacas minuta]|nr:hypothetical protein [Cenarchaeum symbiont of Oopsacas minuta]
MKNIARISTRGRFDLLDGRPIDGHSPYTLYPTRSFKKIQGSKEITIMVHGLQNNSIGALKKFAIAKHRLKKLGYDHPVIGFTYDSNTRGAHLKKTKLRALRAGRRIARYNGKLLAKFLIDFSKSNPKTKFRLLGHSLGSEVISKTIQHLDKTKHYHLVSGIYFFGASVPSCTICLDRTGAIMQRTVEKKIVNYYNPNDNVLQEATDEKSIQKPLGLGISCKPISKYVQRRVWPINHRFASYAATLEHFP